jgi:adenylylsulfate kinase-like enzyme
LGSLFDNPLRFTITTIAVKSSTEVRANLSTETCQNGDPQNPCKQTNEGEISNMTKVHNSHKVPLNPELTVFIEKPEESASDVIAYQYTFEHNR